MRKNIWQNKGSITTTKTGVSSMTLPSELKPDTTNKERYPAFKATPEEVSLQALMTGSLANLFYTSTKENTKMFIDAFNAIDTKILAKQIVYAREKGFTRTIPIAATVVLSKRDVELFKKVVHRIMKTPHDWRQFMDICRSGEIRKGIGRALKREINVDIAKMGSYHSIKYPTDVYDMINLARPNAKINPVIVEYIKGLKDKYKYLMEGKSDVAIEACRLLKDKELTEDNIVKIIIGSRLPYEFVVGSVKVTPKIWETLLYNAPYRNLINNLNNFGRNGVFDNPKNLKYALESIMSPDKIKHSKMFPFRFYIAWKNIGTQTTVDEYGDKSYSYFESSYTGMSEIRNALQKALEISVANIPEIKDRVCIAPDISGSMSSNVLENEDRSKLKCIDLVGLFTGIILQKCKQGNPNLSHIVLPFNNNVNTNLAKIISTRETIFDVAKEFRADGGTSLSAPVSFLIQTHTVVDRIIAFTDEEEWVGSSFIDEFYAYKTTIAPNCKAYLVKLIPSGHDAAPPNIQDINFIYGWNENVLRYVTSDLESQMDEVEKIEL